MVRCKSCGCLFSNQDECPSCGSTYIDELEECVFCGKSVSKPYIWNGVCSDCQKQYATVDTAIGFGERYTDVVEINGFVSYFLGSDRINEILTNYVRNANQETLAKDAERFCSDDFDCFTLYLNELKDEPDKIQVRNRLHRKLKRRKN